MSHRSDSSSEANSSWGDKPEKGGIDVEMEGLPLFYYFRVQSHLLCVCEESKVPFITLDSLRGNLQKMLTALFNLV